MLQCASSLSLAAEIIQEVKFKSFMTASRLYIALSRTREKITTHPTLAAEVLLSYLPPKPRADRAIFSSPLADCVLAYGLGTQGMHGFHLNFKGVQGKVEYSADQESDVKRQLELGGESQVFMVGYSRTISIGGDSWRRDRMFTNITRTKEILRSFGFPVIDTPIDTDRDGGAFFKPNCDTIKSSDLPKNDMKFGKFFVPSWWHNNPMLFVMHEDIPHAYSRVTGKIRPFTTEDIPPSRDSLPMELQQLFVRLEAQKGSDTNQRIQGSFTAVEEQKRSANPANGRM